MMSSNADAQSLLKVAKKRMMQSPGCSLQIASKFKKRVFTQAETANTKAVTGGLVGESSSKCI